MSGIAEFIGQADRIIDITVALDKFDKIGQENVNSELRSKGLTEESISNLQPFLQLKGKTGEKLEALGNLLSASEAGMNGIEELRILFNLIEKSSSHE